MAILKAAVGLILLSCLTGCGVGTVMSNDQIILETHKCEAAGLKAQPIYYSNGEVAMIQCIPKN